MFWRHPFLGITTLAYLGFVGFVTLSPTPYGETSANLLDRILQVFANHDSTQWLTFSTVEQLANIALFVPVGVFLLVVFGPRLWWLAIIGGAAASTLIEWLQGHFLPTRVSDPTDIVMNTIGTVIGVLLALLLTAGSEHRHRVARRQAEVIEHQRQELETLRGRAGSGRSTARPQAQHPHIEGQSPRT